MNLLLISHSSIMNGAQKSLLDLAVGLKKSSEFNLIVLCPEEGALTEALRNKNIHVKVKHLQRPKRSPFHLLLFVLQWLPTVLWLWYFLNLEQIDIVYNNTIDALYGPFAARLAGKPCIWHIREVKPKNQSLRKIFAILLKKLPHRVLFNSNSILKTYSEKTHSHWHVIYNGIAVDFILTRIQRKDDRVVIGFVGQMVSHKRPERFVQIFALADQSMANLQGIMAGDGNLLNDIRQMVDNLGLSNKIDILGRIDDIRQLYRQIDILVLTSDYEPFGRVLIEAMAAGCSIVAANVDGVSEVVVHEESGYLVPFNNIPAYVERVLYLARDKDTRLRIGNVGRERVYTHFTMEKYCYEITKIIKELLMVNRL